MIPADLLDQLREKDLELWEQITGLELAEYEYDDENGSMSEYIYQEDLIEGAQEAWLQYCLQAAIRERRWSYKQICLVRRGTPNEIFYYAEIDKGIAWDSPLHFEGHGDTEAEALVKAYLAAISHK